MKRWLLHIWCIGVFGMLAASCSQIIDDPIADGDCKLETEEVKVTFTIAMGNPDSGSRADISSNDPWGDYDEENENETMGNRYFDNKIEPNKLQVIICDASYNPIVEVEKLLYTQTGTNVYTFTGSFTAEMSANNSYKIVVFANCPDVTISEDTKASIWENYIPSQMPQSGKTEDLTSIPMWGVETISGYAFTPGTNTNIGTIFVLRAMAKVEIELDEAIADEYSLTRAEFNTYNKFVNCIPKGYNGYTYNNGTEDVVVTVEKTEDLRTISTFNPNSTPSGTELAFMTVIENRLLVAYVPEYDNDGSLKMVVNLKKGTQDGKDYDILFNDLRAATTTPFDVIRNHYYKYTITGVSNGLDLTLAVVPWAENEDMLDYTENTVGYNVTGNDYGWKNHYGFDKDDSKILYLNTGNNVAPATYKFLLMTPLNAEWKAVLNGSSNLEFVEGDGYSGELVESNGSNITVQGFNGNTYDGTVITLGVKAKDSNAVGQYSAILHFYVNLGNKWYEIDLVDGNESNGLNYWTIKHNKSSV